MKYLITTLSLFVSFVVSSQVVTVEYNEEVFFAFQKQKSLLEQWDSNEVVWGDACGFLNDEGIIQYVFDFNNMTVELKYIENNGDIGLQGKWDIMYMISDFDSETNHFSCVANTELGDYFYELTKTVQGEFMLLRYYNNDNAVDVWALPSLDWNVYGVALGNVGSAKFTVN